MSMFGPHQVIVQSQPAWAKRSAPIGQHIQYVNKEAIASNKTNVYFKCNSKRTLDKRWQCFDGIFNETEIITSSLQSVNSEL